MVLEKIALNSFCGLLSFTNDTLNHFKKIVDNFAWEDWQTTDHYQPM
jgi:hypothetical protein